MREDKFATIVVNEAANVPQYAEIEPPPGAGLSDEVSFAKSVKLNELNFSFGSSIRYSMILSLGLKSNKSSRPKLFTAIFIISDSGIPNDLFVF